MGFGVRVAGQLLRPRAQGKVWTLSHLRWEPWEGRGPWQAPAWRAGHRGPLRAAVCQPGLGSLSRWQVRKPVGWWRVLENRSRGLLLHVGSLGYPGAGPGAHGGPPLGRQRLSKQAPFLSLSSQKPHPSAGQRQCLLETLPSQRPCCQMLNLPHKKSEDKMCSSHSSKTNMYKTAQSPLEQQVSQW